MANIFEHLSELSYPGRGIIMGHTPSGKTVHAYFIMGRSENSRNRVFVKTDDGIKTMAYDETKMTDPSLIIYHPVRHMDDCTIVTNGDQTDTIRDFMQNGKTMGEALATREFEPDKPNYTPRISGVMKLDGSYTLSILKTCDGNTCERFYYNYVPKNGRATFISTYEGHGEPLPSFHGEPLCVYMPEMDSLEFARRMWKSLDVENRVALWVEIDGEAVIINKFS